MIPRYYVVIHLFKIWLLPKLFNYKVSLWGGDVSLTNLDLRLDVLEEEFRLPFNLVSGHIHELQIHVPWTRLQSEPIVLTINTIECVLKLPNDGDKDDTARSDSDSVTSQVPN